MDRARSSLGEMRGLASFFTDLVVAMGAYGRTRPERVLLVLLVLANLALIAWLPILGGHDLPQHLSYARILADYGDSKLPFRETFTLPDGPQAYFTTYYVLAALARVAGGVMNACRLLYGAYAIALPLGFLSLASALNEDDPRTPCWTALLGPLFVWNPVSCMGFLPFMLALPVLLWGAAEAQRWQRTLAFRHGSKLVLACAVAVSLHVVAALFFLAFAALFLVARPGKRALGLFAIVAVAIATSIVLWQWAGPGHVAAMPPGALAARIANDGPWTGLASAVGARWNSPREKLELLAATLLCPFPLFGKVLVGVVFAGIGLTAWSGWIPRPRRKEQGAAFSARASFALALVGFAMLTATLPTSLSAPDDICLIDFRAMVVLVVFSAAAIDSRVFAPARARIALALGSAIVTLLWVRQLAGVAAEGQQVVRLVRRLGASDVLLALPFHDRSEYLDDSNGLTHYLPVYHTVLNGGVTSLFWGRFSQHLPVGYRPGKEPSHPPDWRPWEFTGRDLDGASSVLVEWPDADDDEPAREGAGRLRAELDRRSPPPVACEGRWCLYSRPPRPAGVSGLTVLPAERLAPSEKPRKI
jgi:hypothetical protein